MNDIRYSGVNKETRFVKGFEGIGSASGDYIYQLRQLTGEGKVVCISELTIDGYGSEGKYCHRYESSYGFSRKSEHYRRLCEVK